MDKTPPSALRFSRRTVGFMRRVMKGHQARLCKSDQY
jgi:hypothetical protein